MQDVEQPRLPGIEWEQYLKPEPRWADTAGLLRIMKMFEELDRLSVLRLDEQLSFPQDAVVAPTATQSTQEGNQ